MRKPQVFLFDEPLSNLDAALRGQTRVELARLHRDLNTTMIYVTHDQVEAMTLGQKIVVLNGGRIEQAGTPLELYEHPANRFVAGFLGSPRMNFLPGMLAGEEEREVLVRLPGAATARVAADVGRAPPGAPVTLGVRPEHLRVVRLDDEHAASHSISAEVTLVEYLGDATIVYAQVPGVEEMVSIKCRPDEACPGRGARIGLAFDAARGHLFDQEGVAFTRTAGGA